ncbi:MAG TPA: hypothetical protein VFA79_05895 [Myxococcales bacterium]|nr:hypothetical protein [Myxococcales bacterium]
MRRAAATAIAAAVASGCMLIVDDGLDAGRIGGGFDSGQPDVGGGGGGGGGRDSGDSGGGRTILGSGTNGDNGTAVLALLRVDQGTANLADPVASLLDTLSAGLGAHGLLVTSVAVADLYAPQTVLWAARGKQPSAAPLGGVLRAISATKSGTPPATCTTAALLTDGTSLLAWNAGGVFPFNPPPGALLVVLIDTGARPFPLSGCTDSQMLWLTDPQQWALFGRPIRRGQTHFLLLGTSETESMDAMRTRCASVSGFPTTALDALAPSAAAFFGPMATQMNATSGDLATSVDLCTGLSVGAPTFWEDMGNRWVQQLETLQ